MQEKVGFGFHSITRLMQYPSSSAVKQTIKSDIQSNFNYPASSGISKKVWILKNPDNRNMNVNDSLRNDYIQIREKRPDNRKN